MSMDKLIYAIGPAPSEIPYDDLIEKLMLERERINKVLSSPKIIKQVTSKTKKQKKNPTPRTKKTISRSDANDILRRILDGTN